MRPFFEPDVIAVIGANRLRGRIGSEILHNIIAKRFHRARRARASRRERGGRRCLRFDACRISMVPSISR